MSAERCNEEVHKENPHILFYDWEYYRQLLPLIEGDVLDVGCGAGMFIKEYAKKDEVTSIVGVDKYGDEFPELEKATFHKIRLPGEIPGGFFDTVVSTEFVEHIEFDELEPMLIEIKKHMKPTSLFIGSTPNKVAPTTNPYHLYEYTLSELVSILKNHFPTVEAFDNGQNCTIFKCLII